MNKMMILPAVLVFLTFTSAQAWAQQSEKAARFSNTGIKASIGTATFDMLDERGLQEGEGGALRLGYGFTSRFSLWLTLLGSKHARVNSDVKNVEFSGLELNIEHKFQNDSRLQPYGRVGVGVYGLREENAASTLTGAGLSIGLGADYFLSRHFGIGAELTYKKLDYLQQTQEQGGGEFVSDISPNLNGDTVGFLLSLTIE